MDGMRLTWMLSLGLPVLAAHLVLDRSDQGASVAFSKSARRTLRELGRPAPGRGSGTLGPENRASGRSPGGFDVDCCWPPSWGWPCG